MDGSRKLRVDAWKPFGQNLIAVVGPMVADVGIPAAQWQAVTTTFSAYADAYDAAAEAATRNPAAVQARNDALDAFRRALKPVVAVLMTSPAVTNAQRKTMGLKVRDGVTSVVPSPRSAPTLSATLTGPESAHLAASDPADPHRRGKPVGCRALLVMTHFGDRPPVDPSAWSISRLSSRTTVDLVWAGIDAATNVWFSASYVGTRNETGPMSTPVCIRLPGPATGTAASATAGEPAMKIAA